MLPIPDGYISLRDAFGKLGRELFPGWTDTELDDDADASAIARRDETESEFRKRAHGRRIATYLWNETTGDINVCESRRWIATRVQVDWAEGTMSWELRRRLMETEPRRCEFRVLVLPGFTSNRATKPMHEPDPFRTGGQGRPTMKHLIRQEFERRVDNKEVIAPKLAQEARELRCWASNKYKDGPIPTQHTIENQIRDLYRKATTANPTK